MGMKRPFSSSTIWGTAVFSSSTSRQGYWLNGRIRSAPDAAIDGIPPPSASGSGAIGPTLTDSGSLEIRGGFYVRRNQSGLTFYALRFTATPARSAEFIPRSPRQVLRQNVGEQGIEARVTGYRFGRFHQQARGKIKRGESGRKRWPRCISQKITKLRSLTLPLTSYL
jgi:hypothetical protein